MLAPRVVDTGYYVSTQVSDGRLQHELVKRRCSAGQRGDSVLTQATLDRV
ncbi:hypothetical protein GFS60_08083 (plasmid) [Rhodococcus sp. WAY2]|nr:hypothetical protein GFS60_08083 [Rhodococcus sp. WAY2]